MSKAKFFEMAEKAGIAIDYTPGGRDKWTGIYYHFTCMCDAPHGKLFKGTQLHCEGGIQGLDGAKGTDWKGACEMLATLIAGGFDDCLDPDCEICNPENVDVYTDYNSEE